MQLVIIADVFPPLRSSGAVQLYDLSVEMVRQGHEPTILVATPELDQPWLLESVNGVRILRLKTPNTKDASYVRRTFGELVMPFAMLRNLRRSPIEQEKWDGIVWYSPTIFLGPIVHALKRKNRCRAYLIIRDIFPAWALDMGLIRRGLAYWFFQQIADFQYTQADVIGIQTKGNSVYFDSQARHSKRRTEVLHNWLADRPIGACSIVVSNTMLVGRTIFVYAGNMGIAQGMGSVLDLATSLSDRQDIGFVLVGRGSDAGRLRTEAATRALNNVIFFDEIDPDEIPALYAQCHIGLVALDPRHKSHNIPGKFLSYMISGLPVLAMINAGNDLETLVTRENVGIATPSHESSDIAKSALALVAAVQDDPGAYTTRCRSLAAQMFSPTSAVAQIITGLRS